MKDHVHATLATAHELSQYASLLQTSHWQTLGLLSADSTRFDMAFVKNHVIGKLKIEWTTILQLELNSHASQLLKKFVPYTRWQVYRETMSVLESNKWTLNQEVLDLLLAWWPPVQSSSNVEDVFASLQDSLQRASKSDCGSLANLSCCAIRAVEKRTKNNPALEHLSLLAEDFEGQEVRGLRPGVFDPASCPPSFSYLIPIKNLCPLCEIVTFPPKCIQGNASVSIQTPA